MRRIEKQIMLQVLDTLWKEHLATMDHLRQGIHLRAYAQKNPKQEYKRESFELFEQLLKNLKYEVVKFLSHVQIQRQDEAAQIEHQRREAAEREKLAFHHAEASAMASPEGDAESRENASRHPHRPLPVTSPRSVAMNPAPAAAARSTSSATESYEAAYLARAGSDMAVGDDTRVCCTLYPVCAWQRYPQASRSPGRKDLVLMELAEGASAAAVFTRNAFCAAPVTVAQRAPALSADQPRYLLINTGNANAGTGAAGIAAARSCIRTGGNAAGEVLR